MLARTIRCPVPTTAWPLIRHHSSAFACRRSHNSSGPPQSTSRSGEVYFITGSTDGIGQHTAAKLAADGATVLIHGRNSDKIRRTVESLKQQTGNSSIQGYTADLADLAAVRQLAAAVSQDYPLIHALVNNAGVYETQRRVSKDGYELTWAVNVLAPFLLTSLLWRNVSSKIITTASISAASHLDMNNLQQERGYSAHDAYSLSKLCDIIFTLKLSQYLKANNSKVTTNTLDPGTVNTKMLLAGWGRIGIEVESANNTYKLLTDSGVDDVSGGYFVGHRRSRPPRIAEDAQVQQQLWQLWEQQTGAVYD